MSLLVPHCEQETLPILTVGTDRKIPWVWALRRMFLLSELNPTGKWRFELQDWGILGPIPSLGIYISGIFWPIGCKHLRKRSEKIVLIVLEALLKEEPAFCLGETIAIHGQMDRLLKANWQKWTSKMMPWACLKPGDRRMPQIIKRSQLGRRFPDWTKKACAAAGQNSEATKSKYKTTWDFRSRVLKHI